MAAFVRNGFVYSPASIFGICIRLSLEFACLLLYMHGEASKAGLSCLVSCLFTFYTAVMMSFGYVFPFDMAGAHGRLLN